MTLKGSKPSIWRRIQVNEDIALFDLHCILQEAMGWTNSHLHQFILDGKVYSHPDFEMDEGGDEILDERKFRLMRLPLQEKTKFIYEWSYADFIKAIKDPKHPEHKSMRDGS